MSWLAACREGDLDQVQAIWATDVEGLLDAQAGWLAACEGGHIETAEWLWATGEAWWVDEALVSACTGGHLPLVQWLVTLHPRPRWSWAWMCTCRAGELPMAQWIWEQETTDWRGDTVLWRVVDGRMYLHWRMQEVWRDVCKEGLLTMAQWLWTLRDSATGRRMLGKVDAWRGSPVPVGLRVAAKCGHRGLVSWLTEIVLSEEEHETGDLTRASWKLLLSVAQEAYQAGEITTADWLLEVLGPDASFSCEQWKTYHMLYRSVKSGNQAALERYHADGYLDPRHLPDYCQDAARRGHLPLLQWLEERSDHPPTWVSLAYRMTAEDGHLPVLQWLHHYHPLGLRCQHRAYGRAAAAGQTHVLGWLESLGAPPTRVRLRAWAGASRAGEVVAAQWVWGSGPRLCPGPELLRQVWTEAVRGGHLETAQWLTTLGQWELGDTYPLWHLACIRDRLELARWLWSLDPSHDVRQRQQTWIQVCRRGSLRMVRWIWSLGPLDHHHADEAAWWGACLYGSPAVARLVWDLGGVDHRARDDQVWWQAAASDRRWLLRWLWELGMPESVINRTRARYPYSRKLSRKWHRDRRLKSARSAR